MQKLQKLTVHRSAWAVLIVLTGFVVCGLYSLLIAAPDTALADTNPTPLPIHIASATATQPLVSSPTPSRTVAPIGSSVIEAKDKTVGANIRQSPDPGSEKLGTIFPGKFYPVVGKFGNWYQIIYGQPDPDSSGWVYKDIVNLSGPPPALIPTASSVPTSNVATGSVKATAEHLTLTPGGIESATALQLSATGVIAVNANGTAIAPTSGQPLPTFTFPPPLIEATLSPRINAVSAQGSIPPIVPIIGLSAVGLLGLLISGLRRS